MFSQSAASHQSSEDMYLKWYRYSSVNVARKLAWHMCVLATVVLQIGMMIWFSVQHFSSHLGTLCMELYAAGALVIVMLHSPGIYCLDKLCI